MKYYDRIMWSLFLCFIGVIILLDNFHIINFYWWHIFKFWPVALIITGFTMALNRNGSQLGSKISLVVLVASLAIFFVKGQNNSFGLNCSWGTISENDLKEELDDDDDRKTVIQDFKEPFKPGDSAKLAVLNLNGGNGYYKLETATSNLFDAEVIKKSSFGTFGLTKLSTDNTTNLTFKLKEGDPKNKRYNLNKKNRIELKLNEKPVWMLNLNMGVGDIDFDLKKFKIREVNFNGGAAKFEVKIGDLLPVTDVNINSGIAKISISVPQTLGCQINTHMGLSVKNFKGFTKVGDNLYQTAGFKSASRKVFVNLDGGLSAFEVERY